MFTALMRRTPFDDLFALGDQLTRFWTDDAARHEPRRPWTQQTAQFTPSVDVRTDEDGWRLRVAVPGIAPEDVDVMVAGHRLHIRAVEREGSSTHARYEQTISVPEAVDAERIAATCRHGMLEVALPFKETVRPRRIEVSTDGAKQLSA